ncbi:MAG: creatininase family protein [Bacteroidetes bacterium]|nr:MAG: creatininase family protein [Bacteroidota bacterium]
MKPFILEQTNWKQVKNEKYEVAVLPWGATEPHNYHLPYGTDTLETSKIAEEAAEKAWKRGAKIMVLPTIPLGVQNPGQIEMPFCLHTKPSTQTLIFKDIVEALNKQGINKLVLINGHGGNDFKPMIREIQTQFPEMLISLVEWFKIVDLSGYFEEQGDHAGEMETSVIMHYFPHLVLPLKDAGDGKAKSSRLKGVLNKTAWIPRQWDKVSEDTGVGNPKKATAEKGKIYIEYITTKIADFLVEIATCDSKNLYE